MDGSLYHRLLLSATAAGVAEGTTYPLDFLKTRLQLHQSRQAAGLLTTAARVITQEGLVGLYAGMSPAVVRHFAYTPVRVVAFESLRRWNFGAAGEPVGLPSLLVFGFTAGALGQLVASPADLVKVRMQADGRLVAAGLQARPRYTGLVDAFLKITHEEGVHGLWRGSLPAVQRAALVNLGELSAYDSAKQLVLRSGITGGDNVQAHVLAAMCSGLCSSVVSTPADVVKSRLMSQDQRNPQYRGVVDCFVTTWRQEGARGLYKGFLPTWARLGPWQLTFWVTFEHLRRVSGMQSF